MFVPEINEVKDYLEQLKKEKVIEAWELPYENLLTRLSAAIFFLTPKDDKAAKAVWKGLKKFGKTIEPNLNEEKKLSNLQYQVTIDKWP